MLKKQAGIESGNCKLNTSVGGLTTHASVGSTRLVGDTAEAQVRHVLGQAGLRVVETRNSGALYFDGDMCISMDNTDGNYIRAECKHRNTSGFTISKDHWSDIKSKSVKHGGTPALILHNKEGEMLVTMELRHFANIVGNLCHTKT